MRRQGWQPAATTTNDGRMVKEEAEEATARRPRAWRRRLFEIGLFLLALYGIHRWQTRDAAAGQAPALRGADLEGELVDVAAEGPTVVHFWATWCGVCDAMDDNVAALAEDHRVITVAVRSEGRAAIRAHLAEEGLEGAFPVVADPQGVLAARWGVSAFPTTFVVGSGGRIHATSVGYTTTVGMRARLAWSD
jgi:thiol-disulfide isomerase/thioredoxin